MFYFDNKVSLHHSITAESALASPTPQRELSSKIDENVFKALFGASFTANKGQLLSVLASYVASWLYVVPFHGLISWSPISSRLQ